MKIKLFTRFKILLILLLVFIVFPSFLNLYMDWLWFGEVGFQSVFLTTLAAKFGVGLVAAVIAFLFLGLNILLFSRLARHVPLVIKLKKQTSVEVIDVTRGLQKLALPALMLVSLLIGLMASGGWRTVLLFLKQTPFGSSDPLFARDIGYFVFSMPFLETASSFGISLIVLSFLTTAVLYLMQGALSFRARGVNGLRALGRDLVSISREARTHLLILAGLLFVATAIKIYFLRIPNLVYSETGPLFGASYSDVYALLPALRALAVTGLLAALAAFYSAIRGRFRPFIFAIILYFLVSIIGTGVFPNVVQNFVVTPNELNKETPYIEKHIAATRDAWDIQDVVKRELSGTSSLGVRDVEANKSTIDNIRLWDRDPLLDTFSQLQEIRTYYDFNSVDDDRYVINGEQRQILISPRELDAYSLPQRTFINEHIIFTHGMGVTAAPVNLRTNQGLPVLFTKDLPPETNIPELAIMRPEIYFGELTDDYVVVNTKQKEFNYPSGENNVFTTYEGTGGVPVVSLLRKALFALYFGQFKILLSTDITEESRIMMNRNVLSRVWKALPFLELDGDPYIVIDQGELKWVFDAYTMTDRYPYSEPVSGINYMRNAAKVVVNAYSGTIDAYIADAEDPIIQAWNGIYPGIMKPISEMPDSLRAHVRYPEDLFNYQSYVYMTYHMDEPQIFYNREDEWEVPAVQYGDGSQGTQPMIRHTVMKLPGEESEEFILMLPFTPRGKDNMSAWMVARSDGEHYGELVVYRFSKQRLQFGPQQVVNRINQDPDVSQQISLWDQRGSEVIQGNLYVIPINESILYVRPLYLRAEGGRIPELKRVIVLYEDTIVMEENLDTALQRVFSGFVPKASVAPGGAEANDGTSESGNVTLIEQAQSHYAKAQEALRAGDFAAYGDEMKRLGEALQRLGK